ncbi:XdhC family protein [Cyclobacterium qasimii]|uniref:Xanthine and CO dehydrogenases maturation factor, XdhC/CoxF family n=2 Tax=Cyclobacterium qasimii TaxID=1350429 RepID=S7WN28_9BACT|nr:XdhC/CoxI family protein [Cyclobacterium qasimii]EPR68124.1 Xanthine and CO dehydrogenases maturation factor, XdhC/CoxF family [Cyclobacterium qasimii M12-11B]GEO19980.1 putative xanthine dehydrogenase subunit A [Cyclobacterium qasimii]
MKEIKEILKAYAIAVENNEKTALATVVNVDGSSYRRPGARMLITENGELTGAISGGCLEGDALKKAQMVIFQQRAMLVTYDTTDEDDAKFGVGLGCNGIIHILIEPIDENNGNNPILLLKSCVKNRESKVLVTLFDFKHKRGAQPGTILLVAAENTSANKQFDQIHSAIKSFILEEAKSVISTKRSSILPVIESEFTAFIEYMAPAIKLNILGAGNDVIPLVKLAAIMGWEICIADGRSDLVTGIRFPEAEELIIGKGDEVVRKLDVDSRTAVVLMTHNFNYDLAILKGLYPYKCPYIGVLGPKKKLLKLKEQLWINGVELQNEEDKLIFGPMGLDIGAEGPEEIALSIMSEIKAVMTGSMGGYLKSKDGPIHNH